MHGGFAAAARPAMGTVYWCQPLDEEVWDSALSICSSAALDAAASHNLAAHMVGVSKVARVHAASPPAVMISAA